MHKLPSNFLPLSAAAADHGHRAHDRPVEAKRQNRGRPAGQRCGVRRPPSSRAVPASRRLPDARCIAGPAPRSRRALRDDAARLLSCACRAGLVVVLGVHLMGPRRGAAARARWPRRRGAAAASASRPRGPSVIAGSMARIADPRRQRPSQRSAAPSPPARRRADLAHDKVRVALAEHALDDLRLPVPSPCFLGGDILSLFCCALQCSWRVPRCNTAWGRSCRLQARCVASVFTAMRNYLEHRQKRCAAATRLRVASVYTAR